MASSPHVVVIPFPAQGHVIPLMELSHRLVEQGFKITFVNTEFNHDRIVAACSKMNSDVDAEGIHMVSIPDGLAAGEDRTNLGKLADGFMRVMPGCLEELIAQSESEGKKIRWVIADENMAWALKVAKKMGIRAICFWAAAAAMLALMMSIPRMIQSGILDEYGLPRKNEKFQLYPGMPIINTTRLAWNCAGDSDGQKIIFELVTTGNQFLEHAEFIICNTFNEIESPTLAVFPNILSVGPLLSVAHFNKHLGNFWPEDTSCMNWLDEQPARSVIYVAFGSFTVFDRRQFEELALGLELSSRPFLWVVRPDLIADDPTAAWLDDFRERTGGRGRMVDWSPQKRILAHPSIACFVTHCGWNSTLEGLWNGVPFLCWPYFTDQFLNQIYICDVWKTGLTLEPDDGGRLISRERIKGKLEELLGDEGIKARALALRDKARRSVVGGGSSHKNLERVVETMRQEN
ncbi:UDP-glycosyltransferase 83A1-like [Canna indica]|uniref:UDP-glycosyltransferase 83A1-like n=1 Tax=Canna indica TaxID=4628 RepID=A0AAQ3Q7W8_9LILI|nr:UDP-glycosyltransferase 83A1-like [Canna indica]